LGAIPENEDSPPQRQWGIIRKNYYLKKSPKPPFTKWGFKETPQQRLSGIKKLIKVIKKEDLFYRIIQ
jgi:hypothetical protein